MLKFVYKNKLSKKNIACLVHVDMLDDFYYLILKYTFDVSVEDNIKCSNIKLFVCLNICFVVL